MSFLPLPANSCNTKMLTGILWYHHICKNSKLLLHASIPVFVFNGNASAYCPRWVWMPPPGTAWHSDYLPAETQTQTRRARHRCIIPCRLYHLPSAPVWVQSRQHQRLSADPHLLPQADLTWDSFKVVLWIVPSGSRAGPGALSVRFLSISCSFQQRFCKITGWCILFGGWCTPLWGCLTQPLIGNSVNCRLLVPVHFTFSSELQLASSSFYIFTARSCRKVLFLLMFVCSQKGGVGLCMMSLPVRLPDPGGFLLCLAVCTSKRGSLFKGLCLGGGGSLSQRLPVHLMEATGMHSCHLLLHGKINF